MGAYSDNESGCDSSENTALDSKSRKPSKKLKPLTPYQQNIAVFMLCLINFLNYVDRYTIISNMEEHLKPYFGLDDRQVGLINSIFIIAYMIASPVLGYFGDRYSRKMQIMLGTLCWTGFVFLGSMVYLTDEEHTAENKAERDRKYWYLLCTRMGFGVGEACYMCVAPAIIHDIFTSDKARTISLVLFNMMIPVGGGAGFILGPLAASSMGGSWQWAMRITIPFTILTVVIFWFVYRDIPQGFAELLQQQESRSPLADNSKVSSDSDNRPVQFNRTSFQSTLKFFMTNKTYVFTVLGFTCVCFDSGAGTSFLPSLFSRALQLNNEGVEVTHVPMTFGAISSFSGLVGVGLGGYLATIWKTRGNDRAESDVCAIGMLFGSICWYICMVLVRESESLGYLCYFLGAVTINFNWALAIKIAMEVVRPDEKSSANAMLTLVAHLLGDAISPILIGSLSEIIGAYLLKNDERFKGVDPTDTRLQFYKLQQPLLLMPLVAAMGSVFFFFASLYIKQDIERVHNPSTMLVSSNTPTHMVTSSDELTGDDVTKGGVDKVPSPPSYDIAKRQLLNSRPREVVYSERHPPSFPIPKKEEIYNTRVTQ